MSFDFRQDLAGGSAGARRKEIGDVEHHEGEDDERQAPFEPALVASHPVEHCHTLFLQEIVDRNTAVSGRSQPGPYVIYFWARRTYGGLPLPEGKAIWGAGWKSSIRCHPRRVSAPTLPPDSDRPSEH